jgi:hypothetical protein
MSGGIIPAGNGLVYSTGYALGVANLGTGLVWIAETETLDVGVLSWESLPAEAQSFPIVMSIPGKPASGVRVMFSLPLGYTVPANFGGSTVIADVAASEDAIFQFSIIRAGATIELGAIMLTTAGGTGAVFSEQAAFRIQPGDGLLMVTPTQDATLSGVAITLLLAKI